MKTPKLLTRQKVESTRALSRRSLLSRAPLKALCFVSLACFAFNLHAQTTLSGDHVISGDLNVGTTGTSGDLRVTGTSFFQGNVGIGVEEPTHTLEVAGGGVFFAIGEGEGVTVHHGADGVPQFRVDGENRCTLLQEASGRVGIGTATPATTLDVNGTTTISGNLNIRSGGMISIFSASGTSASIVIDPTSAGMTINGRQVLLPNLSGNVGIGTSNPTQQLEITGNFGLPVTTSATSGVIMSGTNRLLHAKGTDNVFIGSNSGNFTLTGNGNVGVGSYTLDALTTGIANFALGFDALGNVTSGNHNVAIGPAALKYLTTGAGNMAIGADAMQQTTTSWYNVAVGIYSLYSFNAGGGTAIGFGSGQQATGYGPTFIGYEAGKAITSGQYNTAVGWEALNSDGTTASTNGSYRTAIGAGAQVTANNTIAIGGTGTFAANTILGGTAASAKLHVIKTSEQVRVGYDTSNYYSTTVNSTGQVTLNASGSNAAFVFSDTVTADSGMVVNGMIRIQRQGDILMGEFGEPE